MLDQMARGLESPLLALAVVLLLGALAASGKVSGLAANLCLLAAWIVAAVATMRSELPDLRLKMAVVCVLAGASLGLSYWISPTSGLLSHLSWARPDITWNFDHRIQRPGRIYLLGISGGGGQESRVVCFQARGRNNLRDPIRHVRGIVRSDRTNVEFPVFFVINGIRVKPEETNGIPPGAEFDISSAVFPPSILATHVEQREGMPISRFLAEFGGLTFVFEYDDKRFVHHFEAQDLREQISAFEAVTHPERPPSVTRKGPPTP